MHQSSTPWWKVIFFIVEFFIGMNITVLDIYLFHVFTHQQNQPIANTQPQVQIPISSESALLAIPTATPTPLPIPTSRPVSVVQPAVKEYFIPFGTGQGYATDWATVPGLQAFIDSSSYPNIKQITFEATVHVPAANESVQLRLFDSTDGHPVWYSDLNFSGTADGQFMTSQKINLDSGSKTYVVQMKTQLGSQAITDQARIHITLN